MLLAIAVVLFVLWAFGLLAFHVTTSLVHVLLVVALVAMIVHFARGWNARRMA